VVGDDVRLITAAAITWCVLSVAFAVGWSLGGMAYDRREYP
jgi:hypothetical protein